MVQHSQWWSLHMTECWMTMCTFALDPGMCDLGCWSHIQSWRFWNHSHDMSQSRLITTCYCVIEVTCMQLDHHVWLVHCWCIWRILLRIIFFASSLISLQSSLYKLKHFRSDGEDALVKSFSTVTAFSSNIHLHCSLHFQGNIVEKLQQLNVPSVVAKHSFTRHCIIQRSCNLDLWMQKMKLTLTNSNQLGFPPQPYYTQCRRQDGGWGATGGVFLRSPM